MFELQKPAESVSSSGPMLREPKPVFMAAESRVSVRGRAGTPSASNRALEADKAAFQCAEGRDFELKSPVFVHFTSGLSHSVWRLVVFSL